MGRARSGEKGLQIRGAQHMEGQSLPGTVAETTGNGR